MLFRIAKYILMIISGLKNLQRETRLTKFKKKNEIFVRNKENRTEILFNGNECRKICSQGIGVNY